MLVNYFFFRVPCIIELEFAGSAQKMRDCIAEIKGDSYSILKYNTLVDYIFALSYSLLTLYSLIIFLDVFQIRIKAWVYILAFTTGFLDCIENIYLLKTGIDRQEVFSSVFYYVVRVKWAFAIIPMLLIPMMMVYGIILLLRTRTPREMPKAT